LNQRSVDVEAAAGAANSALPERSDRPGRSYGPPARSLRPAGLLACRSTGALRKEQVVAWITVVILAVWAVFNLVFAFVRGPSFIDGLCRVSRIFLLLPDDLVLPVGRLFNFVAGVAGAALIGLLLRNAGY
jgi:hypothetical protein